ncbi:phage integrase [Methylococcus mesophilus]|uniref:phage integrase n=1 Tax=Methylococcus mesophilus TaxID=2993564 RepID=UPI00224B462F|nr:tyrosine-type recombinase/integrase [Methylococcus mesophilus]UZR30216.1 tyrosine-type recombinase/integrase [Methylococcus mesophilus]
MAIKKVPDGWQADVQPGGRGCKRYRKTFRRKVDAERWEQTLKAKVAADPQFVVPQKDTRKLSELVKLWFDLHGVNLKSAVDTYRRLIALCDAVGDPYAYRFSAQVFADYRAERLKAGVSASTLNRERSYLAGVFGELKRLGHWKGENPLSRVRPIRINQPELSFLTAEQIERLLSALRESRNADVYLVAVLALSTGARWSEAEGLRFDNVREKPGLVTFTDTKSRKNRSVPLEDSLAALLASRLRSGPFRPCYGAFRKAVERSGIELPDGQLAHVLRHTFASHFVMKGGDILTLQRILGHHSITVTMRYAHLAPEYLEQAKRFNPLSALTLG